MKTMMRALLLAFVIFAAQNFAEAQSKIGFIYGDSLLLEMPEYDSVLTKINKRSEEYKKTISSMQDELDAKSTKFQRDQAKPDIPKSYLELAQNELESMYQNIQTFSQNAQKELMEYQNKLMEPLITKMKNACAEVSKEQKYDFIVDAGSNLFWHMSEKDNLMNAVRKKLGLSTK
ncbi:MAG: OmpH family outer membrane protein [Bacteroidetes bacterium]|nr:MAG: OmpH family outer membrane protein [Bacteroidota bacterium]